MWSILFKYAIFFRVVTLLLGCSSATSMSSQTIPQTHSSERELKLYKSTAVTKNSSPNATFSTSSSPSMKGKGSQEESVSQRATAKKMEQWDVTAQKVQAVAPLVKAAAEKFSVPASLIFGVIWVESRFNPRAVSRVGAKGLMQLMPKTAAYLAKCIDWEGKADSFDPAFNIAAGSYYVAKLLKQFDGDLDLALAAYNAGPTNIRRWMKNTGLPPVSIEYYTMVQTAQQYFPVDTKSGAQPQVLPSKQELDRLGLAILIAGLSNREFGQHRPDDANPFNEM